jgi:iron complex transport system permease protein
MFAGSRKLPPRPVLLALTACLLLAMLAASASGAVHIPWRDLPRLLWGALAPGDELLHNVLLDIRLPRVVFSAITGAALALTGAAIQALFRNPLAEPGLVGISSGAALGAVAAIVLASGGFFLIAGSAFAGSLLATFLAYSIGRRYTGVAGILLAGIAINTVCASGIGLFTYMANDSQLRDLTFWSLGSLAGADWRTLAWTGFIGLVVPHLMRMLLGAHHRVLLPASILGGALILTLADWLARLLVSPAELPIGLVTSLIGGPFFFWLLLRGKASGQNL